MSSANYSTKVSTKVSIGNTAASFQVTTKDKPDSTPDPYSFTHVTDAELNTVYESNEIILVGYEAPAWVNVFAGGGEASINGGPWVTNGLIEPGQSIKIRGKSSDKYAAGVTIKTTIGGVGGGFGIKTKDKPDATPDPYSFLAVTNAELNTVYESEEIVLVGYEAPA